MRASTTRVLASANSTGKSTSSIEVLTVEAATTLESLRDPLGSFITRPRLDYSRERWLRLPVVCILHSRCIYNAELSHCNL